MPARRVIDTCCFINFFASGQATALIKAIGGAVAIPEAVKREAVYLAPFAPGEPRIPIDIDAVVTELKLEVVSPENPAEVSLYVELAAELDDGEAMGLALAKSRSLVLLTDERKARKRATALEVEVLTTCEVVSAWAGTVDERRTIDVINRIRQSARYSPGPKDPLYDWWMKLAAKIPSG